MPAVPATGRAARRDQQGTTVAAPVVHALTIDLEDWSDTQAVRQRGPAELPARIAESTPLLLDLLQRCGARATFFILGGIAAKHPALVRRIAAAGHRIGSHGLSHRPIGQLGPEGLRRELLDTRSALQDAIGAPVQAHRCPSWSLRPATLWALPVIADCGFRFDASLSPGGTPLIGTPGVPGGPHRVRLADGRELREFPMSVTTGWVRLPFSGGFFLRTLPPGWVTRWVRRFERHRTPTVVYAHPWEFDPGTPRVSLRQPWHFLQHHGLAGMTPRFAALLGRHRFAPLEEVADTIAWERMAVWQAPGPRRV